MKRRSYLTHIKDNKVLLVRKVDETVYKLPGGRGEEGETTKDTLAREVMEELSTEVDESSIKLVANYLYKNPETLEEWDTYIFSANIGDQLKPDGKEIEEAIWYSTDSTLELGSHVKTHVMPILINGGFLK